jgi:hypothetical protein
MKKELFELEAEKQNMEEKEVELQCQMLKLLLNPKITSFNFPRGPELATNQPLVTELWQSLVAEQPPDLHTIVCKWNWNQRPFFDSILAVVPNLQVLRLNSL